MLRPRGSKKAAQFTESVIREMTRLAHQHGAAVAADACARLGIGLRMLAASAIPAAAVEQEGLRRLWTREVMLDGSALLVDCEEGEAGDPVVAFLEPIRVPVLVATDRPLRRLRCPRSSMSS